jgi:hypothetical protein
VLDVVARRLNPAHGRMFRGLDMSYYWSAFQTEWATLCRSVFLTRGCSVKWSHYLEDKQLVLVLESAVLAAGFSFPAARLRGLVKRYRLCRLVGKEGSWRMNPLFGRPCTQLR